MGRAALFSDATIIHRLQTEFIPCGAKREDLERSLGGWWLPLVERLNPSHPPGMTTQGSYVLGADGTGYVCDNYNRDPRRLNTLLDIGLARFRLSPPRPVRISPEEIRAASPPEPPPGVSVVSVFARIRPLPAGEPSEFNWVGREQMWIFPDDVRELLAASDNRDGPFALPQALATRIVLFHVLDNTRGEPVPWQPRDVRRATFSMRVTGRADGRRAFAFSGDYAKRGATPFFTDRGHEGHMEGEFEIDTSSRKTTRFRAYSEGQAWGDAPYWRPGNPPRGRYPLVIAMIEANDALAASCPPQAAESGGYYARPPRVGGP